MSREKSWLQDTPSLLTLALIQEQNYSQCEMSRSRYVSRWKCWSFMAERNSKKDLERAGSCLRKHIICSLINIYLMLLQARYWKHLSLRSMHCSPLSSSLNKVGGKLLIRLMLLRLSKWCSTSTLTLPGRLNQLMYFVLDIRLRESSDI